MSVPLVVFGVGELGRFLGGGALRCGYQLVPVLRTTDRRAVWSQMPDDGVVLLAVGEADLDAAMAEVPDRLWSTTVLVQNELFPSRWAHRRGAPSLAVMWTNVKPGQPILVGRRSGLFGAAADALAEIHTALGMPFERLDASQAREELAAKYAFIVTINGLAVREPPSMGPRRTVGAWQRDEPELVAALSDDAVRLACCLAEASPSPAVFAALSSALAGFEGMPAGGRSAARRVQGAVEAAASVGVPLLTLTASPEVS